MSATEEVYVECGACGRTTTIGSRMATCDDRLLDIVRYCPICGGDVEGLEE